MAQPEISKAGYYTEGPLFNWPVVCDKCWTPGGHSTECPTWNYKYGVQHEKERWEKNFAIPKEPWFQVVRAAIGWQIVRLGIWVSQGIWIEMGRWVP